jgi:putative transposase
VWPKTREQRCWVHETTNVRKQAAKEPARQGKRALQGIWVVETKAEAAFDAFVETYAVKY